MTASARVAAAIAIASCSAPSSDGEHRATSPPAAPTPAPRDAATALALADAARALDAAAPAIAIVDAPMAWNDERARLTLAYRRAHSDPDAADITIDPHVVVLHYTGGHSANATRPAFP